MLSAKDINDRLLRLELVVSNLAEQLIGVNMEVKQLMEDIRYAKRVASTAEDDASDCSGC